MGQFSSILSLNSALFSAPLVVAAEEVLQLSCWDFGFCHPLHCVLDDRSVLRATPAASRNATIQNSLKSPATSTALTTTSAVITIVRSTKHSYSQLARF
ncbi:unnamed protein product [Calypogeia fissa]